MDLQKWLFGQDTQYDSVAEERNSLALQREVLSFLYSWWQRMEPEKKLCGT